MDFRIRYLDQRDIPDLMRLKEAAGWNQAQADWLAYRQLEPEGCFVGEANGQVVSSATALSYDSAFGWIGMILVLPAFRRNGYATRMMEKSLEYLEGKDCHTQRLDATEAGANVYRHFGFNEEIAVERWVRRSRENLPSTSLKHDAEISPIVEADLPPLADWDAAAFGSSRHPLLDWYCNNSSPSLVYRTGSAIQGFVMGRAGSDAHQLGPLVAQSSEIAAILAIRFLSEIPNAPVIVDVSRENPQAIELLQSLEFTPSRHLVRMFRGNPPPRSRSERVYFLAGFEFG